MREYGSVSPQFWIGKTGKALRGQPETQLLALYLMTCPHANMIGVFHCPIMYMAHETGLTLEGASKGLQSLIDAGFCLYDQESETVFVIRMAAYQVGETLDAKDNKVKGVQKELSKVAVPSLKAAFIAVYAQAFHLSNEAPSKPLASPDEPPSKQLTGTGQEQEQEQERGACVEAPTSLAATASPPSEQPGTRAGRLCKRLRQEVGFMNIQPANPTLHALLDGGYTDDEIVAVTREAVVQGKSWGWIVKVVQSRREDAAKVRPAAPEDRKSKFAGAI